MTVSATCATSAWTPSFYSYDGMGSVRQLTNTAGSVTDTYEYDAFGNSFTVSGTTPNEMMYRGEQYDPDLGLYYLRARYYNPLTGRFMGRDPEEVIPAYPNTMHKYAYAKSDPVDRFDPTGHADLEEYSLRLIDLYNTFSPALSGHDFAVCANQAFIAEATDMNAAILGLPLPATGPQIAASLESCEQTSLANIIKGHGVYSFSRLLRS